MTQYKGTIIEKFPPARGTGKRGPWTRSDFSLQTEDETLFKCSTFDKFLADVGDEVSLEGEYDEKYKKVSASKIKVLGEAPETEQEVLRPAPKITPLAKKALATSVKPKAVAEPLVTDEGREKNRTLAVTSVRANLLSAIALKAELGLETVDLIALADMVGRTISAITIGQTKRY